MTGNPGPVAARVQALYTRRRRSYVAYVQAFGHRQGIRAALAASSSLRPGQRILGAGCGNGLSIVATVEALRRRGYGHRSLHGFDLTPAMLNACQHRLNREGIEGAELREADVTRLGEQLPPGWTGYDLIVCASMLEYVPRPQLVTALTALRGRLASHGHLFIIVTRKSFLPTRWIWKCGGYTRTQLEEAFGAAGYGHASFRRYPSNFAWLSIASHVIEAAGTGDPPAVRGRAAASR